MASGSSSGRVPRWCIVAVLAGASPWLGAAAQDARPSGWPGLNPMFSPLALDVMRAAGPQRKPTAFYDAYGMHSKIMRRLAADGVVTLDVVPELDSLVWSLSEGGSSIFAFDDEVRQEFEARAKAIVRSLPESGILDLQDLRAAAEHGRFGHGAAATAQPVLRMTVDADGYAHLGSRRDLRAMALAGVDAAPPLKLDPQPLQQARTQGRATVAITLKMLPGYSPLQGWMSPRSWAGQTRNVGAIFAQIVGRLESSALPVEAPGIPVTQVNLGRDAIERLYRDPDPRIASVLGPGEPIPLATTGAR